MQPIKRPEGPQKTERSVLVTGVCPRCHEAVDLVLSKKDIKQLYLLIKLPPETSNRLVERQLLAKVQEETTLAQQGRLLKEAFLKLSEEDQKVLKAILLKLEGKGGS